MANPGLDCVTFIKGFWFMFNKIHTCLCHSLLTYTLAIWICVIPVVGADASDPCDVFGPCASSDPSAAGPYYEEIHPWHDNGVWLMGDTHIHSGTSKESTWTVDDIAAKAVHYGCDFIAFTNHYLPEVQSSLDQARVDYPSLIIFQGLEWRVPRGNRRIDPERSCHPEMTLFVTNHPDETQLINDFRNLFDGYSKPHEKAVEGLVWLENRILNGVKPVCIVNHPSKKGGSYTIDHLRDYDDAGTVCIGISGAPGH
ncbi:MAG: hypothetical protein ACYS14_14020, partial [Planctomycetota bacterium]